MRVIAPGPMKKVLLIEDDRVAAELIRESLDGEGYEVVWMSDGASGLAQVRKTPPDVLLLDLMLPKMSGLDICKAIRSDENLNRLPILMLTARGDEMDRVVGLEIGADDYVTKPFSPRELVLRIKKVLARATAGDDPSGHLRIGDLDIDVSRHAVHVKGKPVTLTATEFKLLEVLVRRRGRVQTRDRLLQDVWGYENPIDTRTVDTHMRRLRERIGPAAHLLETVRGVGYRCSPTA